MAYIKNDWKDQVVERPRTYQMTTNSDGSVTLIDDFGLVTELGTPVNADNMNHIEEGIAGCAIRLYNSTEVFSLNEWAKEGDTIYKSKQDNNFGHATSETDWWEEVSLGGVSMPIGDPIITLSNTLGENEIWLEGAEISRETYAQLFEIYGTTYGEGDGETTFNLPDFRNRTIWGADDFGYIEAGLPNISGIYSQVRATKFATASGPFYKAADEISTLAGAGGDLNRLNSIGFDASRSNLIYGNSTTVQPPSVKVRIKTRFA